MFKHCEKLKSISFGTDCRLKEIKERVFEESGLT